jgi:hypothetical protein
MLWTRAGAADHPTSKTSPNQRIETQNALRHRTSIGHASAPYRANNATEPQRLRKKHQLDRQDGRKRAKGDDSDFK